VTTLPLPAQHRTSSPYNSFISCSGSFIDFSANGFRNILIYATGNITNKTSSRNWLLCYSDTVLEASLARMAMGSLWKIPVLVVVASFISASGVYSNSEGESS
jgi:hypothetical protein